MSDKIKLDGVEANIDDVLAELRKHGDVTFAEKRRMVAKFNSHETEYSGIEIRITEHGYISIHADGSISKVPRNTVYMGIIRDLLSEAIEHVECRGGSE